MQNDTIPDDPDESGSLDDSTPRNVVERAAIQRIRLRYDAVNMAFLIILFYAILEITIWIFIFNQPKEVDKLFVVFAVSPIVGITAIIAVILFGVFRGFRESDLEHLNPRRAAEKAMGGGSD